MNISDTKILTPRVYMRAMLPALCSIWLVWTFSGGLADLSLSDLQLNVSEFNTGTWAVAVLLSWISFCAVAGYDPIISKALGYDIPQRRAISMSWKATAVSQIVGFGLLTGTVVRWLELSLNPNKPSSGTLAQAFKLTLAVTTSFLLAWALITATFTAYTFLTFVEFSALCFGFLTLGWAIHNTRYSASLNLRSHRKVGLKFVVLTLIDTLFAALVIHIFLPPELASFSTLYLAFLLSYGAGLVSGLPGGVGPFEICMIALLPSIDPTLLAPALIGFRIVYFAIPATLAIIFLGLDLATRHVEMMPMERNNTLPSRLRNTAPPEFDLIHNNRLSCLVSYDQTEAALVLEDEQTVIQLGDAFGGKFSSQDTIAQLSAHTSWSKRNYCIYRCSRTTAFQAVAAGLKSVLFSSEAIVRPASFDLRQPNMSSLRRKIRKAAKAGISVNSKTFDLQELEKINDDWITTHGHARGFSTGVYSPDLIKRQRIYVAYKDDNALAFISISLAEASWQLDLIRYKSDCSDGATFALVTHAIEDARLSGVPLFSLGSVPFAPPVQHKSLSGLAYKAVFERSRHLKGLYQFKKTFGPEWHDRYFVAQSVAKGLWAARSVYKAITVPNQTSPSHHS